MSEARFQIGSDHDYLLIEPTRLESPDASDYWDANWLYANVAVQAGAFQGRYEAMLRTDEFRDFREQLAGLYRTLSGAATFDSMEHWIRVHVTGDGRGHFAAKCEMRDAPGMGNSLTFELTFDQTEIPKMLHDLDGLLRAFPVRGSP